MHAGVAGLMRMCGMERTRRWVIGGLAATGLTGSARPTWAGQLPPNLDSLSPQQRAAYEASRARTVAALGYERVTVPGSEALAEWEKLKRSGRGWPVIVGGDEDVARIAEQFSLDEPAGSGAAGSHRGRRSPQEILAAAAKVTFPADLQKWPGAYRPEDMKAPLGDWPVDADLEPSGPLMLAESPSQAVREKVHILLIPTRFGWEVPAYLRWGDWNACPPPEYHVAALRRWHDVFGAELVGIDGDTIAVRAGRPPQTRAAAIKLAREQYGYCPDLIDQGTETLSALAAILMKSEWWNFWWD